MTEIEPRQVEIPGNPPALVEFLNLRYDERLLILGFTPVSVQQSTYTIDMRKLHDITGMDDVELQGDKTVSDREIEEVNIWVRQANKIASNSRLAGLEFGDAKITGRQLSKIDAALTDIDDYATESIIAFLSGGEVRIEDIVPAEPDYKVIRHGVIFNPDLVTLVRTSEEPDGSKKEESLTVTQAKFYDVKWEARVIKFKTHKDLAETEVLENNLRLIDGKFKDYVVATKSPLDE